MVLLVKHGSVGQPRAANMVRKVPLALTKVSANSPEAWKEVVCALAVLAAASSKALKRVRTHDRIIGRSFLSQVNSRGDLGLLDRIQSTCCWLCAAQKTAWSVGSYDNS